MTEPLFVKALTTLNLATPVPRIKPQHLRHFPQKSTFLLAKNVRNFTADAEIYAGKIFKERLTLKSEIATRVTTPAV
jgi:hypothetical protein